MTETFASNPGQIKVDKIRLTLNKPVWPGICIGFIGAIILLAKFLGSFWWFLLTIPFWLALWLFYFRENNHYANGDVNISKVISDNPLTIATSTNMRNSYGDLEYPVVKIVHRKIPKVKGLSWKVGDYLASACLYNGSFEKAFWDDVFPFPLSFATSDADVIRHHESALEYLQEELELRLTLIDDVTKPGLYFVDEAKLNGLRGDKTPEFFE